MNEFHIDRQFGNTIFIDVEAGIVKDCKNESKRFNDKMNEKYVGKTISFLIKDVGEVFRGVYMNVRSTEVIDQQIHVHACSSRIKHQNSLIQMNLRRTSNYPNEVDELQKLLKGLVEVRDGLSVELSNNEKVLNVIRENVQKLHYVEL